ncbi:DUF4168 domain-containing protein [Salipiger marinus]|uniref:DUF4168 domain-containing protein n=1 Tax=Salipiger marinus TaxID=555512 RepID=A0A1G8JTD0_9RHOB|nr:DUF4168 domain-containing protein [Salipiger marinus]SDI34353.1 protein of unknown function [Salipiger marinus]
MKRTSMLLKSTVIAALVAAPMAPVLAQDAMPADPATPAAPEAPAANFSDDQLTSFVDAAMSVQELRQDYMTRIDATEAPEEKQALVTEAQTEMASAVEETDGMDIATYNQIGQAAQADPQLNERIMAMVQTRQGPEDGQGTMTE